MARAGLMLNRAQMLKALPKHVAIAALCGAVAGPILYYLNQIELEGQWNLIMALPIGAIFVNAAIIPLAVPGRHWSFGFIGAMLMFLLLFAGMIISRKVSFPHTHGQLYSRIDDQIVPFDFPIVNAITVLSILSGGCLGLFYGMFGGRISAMVLGLALGSVTGYLLGLLSLNLVTHWNMVAAHVLLLNLESFARVYKDVDNFDQWRFNSPLHFAWQLGAVMALLHLGACLGAALGAGPAPANPKSKIENPKSS